MMHLPPMIHPVIVGVYQGEPGIFKPPCGKLGLVFWGDTCWRTCLHYTHSSCSPLKGAIICHIEGRPHILIMFVSHLHTYSDQLEIKATPYASGN